MLFGEFFAEVTLVLDLRPMTQLVPSDFVPVHVEGHQRRVPTPSTKEFRNTLVPIVLGAYCCWSKTTRKRNRHQGEERNKTDRMNGRTVTCKLRVIEQGREQ